MTTLCPYSQLWLVQIPEHGWDIFDCLVDDGSIAPPENGTLFVRVRTPDKLETIIHTAVLDEITSTARKCSEEKVSLRNRLKTVNAEVNGLQMTVIELKANNEKLSKELRNAQAENDARIRDAQSLHVKIGMAEELIQQYRKGMHAILYSEDADKTDKVKAATVLNKIDLFLEDVG